MSAAEWSTEIGQVRKPRLIDLMCCQGGAGKGYADAGFEVVGVDIEPQPNYPFEFHQLDVTALRVDVVNGCVHEFYGASALPGMSNVCLGKFDAAHASPPCQAKSRAQKIQAREHPRLIGSTREFLRSLGVPYVIENVVPDDPEGDPDPLVDPVMLCGSMFGLETYRHRLFESNVPLSVPEHPAHIARTTKMGRPPREGEFMHIVGNFSGADRGREVMEMPWATRDGLREAIPPAYSKWVGDQLMTHVLAMTTRPGQPS